VIYGLWFMAYGLAVWPEPSGPTRSGFVVYGVEFLPRVGQGSACRTICGGGLFSRSPQVRRRLLICDVLFVAKELGSRAETHRSHQVRRSAVFPEPSGPTRSQGSKISLGFDNFFEFFEGGNAPVTPCAEKRCFSRALRSNQDL
jgi:hypothetical protein